MPEFSKRLKTIVENDETRYKDMWLDYKKMKKVIVQLTGKEKEGKVIKDKVEEKITIATIQASFYRPLVGPIHRCPFTSILANMCE